MDKDKDKDKDKYKENKPEKTTAKVINNKVKPPMVKDTPTGSKMLSSVPIVNETTVANGNIYQTSGKGDDGQFEFSKMVILMGKAQVGYLDCWTDPKNWVMTTAYKQDTGLQAPLYDGLEIKVSWKLFTSTIQKVKTLYIPTLNVDGYGAKTIWNFYGTNSTGSTRKNLDANWMKYGEDMAFVYHKEQDKWLVKTQNKSGSIIYTIDEFGLNDNLSTDNYGYEKLVATSRPIDPDTQPLAHFLFKGTYPNLANTALVGYDNIISPRYVVTPGQVSEDVTGSLEVLNAHLFTKTADTSSTIVHNSSKDIFNNEAKATINTTEGTVSSSTETLTRRLGVYVYYVV